jgi:hypothetical protein
MEKNHSIILLAGILVCVICFIINIYLGGIAAIILVTLAMSFFILEDAKVLPEISVRLHEDAKQVIVSNGGTATAYKIHVAIVPLDIEYDIAGLEPEKSHGHPLGHMINEAKAVISYEDAQGSHYTKTSKLSALGNNEDDLLKPMFPLFNWK